ncbi:MAG TPA: hypothetical protein DIU35_17020, partial [Candidatus Latescibacteria bacterium]|nr:hypothetical protein [Candidatus Latescibacterota bacterium]
MKMFYWFVALLICASATDAQEIGEVSTVELTGGTATVALDFTEKDYELILFPLVTGEEDTARTFSYTVSGTNVSAKPAFRRLPASTGHDGSGRIKAILREEERVLAERIRKRGGWRPSMGKVAQPEQIGSQRTFTYSNFVNSGEDHTVQATLV